MIETWQADPDGRFNHPDDPRGARPFEGFRGFGRSGTDKEGRWRVLTLKPGRMPPPPTASGRRPRHLLVTVFARGMLRRITTRIYFADEADANADRPGAAVAARGRAATLIATPSTADGYRFDIHLQGEHETVFFAL